jgi:hypothetical protein
MHKTSLISLLTGITLITLSNDVLNSYQVLTASEKSLRVLYTLKRVETHFADLANTASSATNTPRLYTRNNSLKRTSPLSQRGKAHTISDKY